MGQKGGSLAESHSPAELTTEVLAALASYWDQARPVPLLKSKGGAAINQEWPSIHLHPLQDTGFPGILGPQKELVQ